jgi:hypothetical protein
MDSKDSESIYIISHCFQEIRSAETLIFSREFNGTKISNIPEGIKHIEIERVSHYQELICLPESLKTLHLNCSFQEIKLPDALEYIKLGPYCEGNIKQWPKSLKKLLICKSGITKLPPLPESLEYLGLDVEFNFNLYQWSGLPKSLKTLIVPSRFFILERILWLKDLSNLS